MSNKNRTLNVRINGGVKEILVQEAKKGFRSLGNQTEMVLMAGLAALDLKLEDEKLEKVA